MEWVAVSTGIAKDPAVHRMAAALRVRVPEAVGLLTLTFAEMTMHAENGEVGEVPDSLLEAWSGWHGKRGAFAAQFRANLCDERGLVRAWEKYNGAAIRRAKAARERARSHRNAKHENADSTHTSTHTGTRTHPVRVRRTRPDLPPASAPNGAERQEEAADASLAPAGAAPADVTADTRTTRPPRPTESQLRAGYRPDPIAPPPPATPLADQAAAIRERADEYRSLLESAATDWMAANPVTTRDIGTEQRAMTGAPRGKLTDWQTQTLRQAVVEAIREREGWPSAEAWDGEPFGVEAHA